MAASTTIKGYELRERIGAGGFGVVYRAYQPSVQREVAIKIILPKHANQPDFIRRFEIEAQIIARLEHPHIVPLYDYWRDPEGAYLIMRWLPTSLRASLEPGVWKLEAAARLLDHLSEALTVAHREGIVHRDIKPENILLDEDSNAYLADFGIAVDTQRHETPAEEEFLGSPAYSSPEQIRSEEVSPRSDIYSLGYVMYEVLTGVAPYPDAKTPSDYIQKHLAVPLPTISQSRPNFPAILDEVLQTATAKNPKLRYPSVQRFAAAFRAALPAALPRVPAQPLVDALTEREIEVMRLVVEGLTNSQICERLVLSPETVKWYMRQIYSKLDVHSRQQAIERALALRLTEPYAARARVDEEEAVDTPTLRISEGAVSARAAVELVNPYKGLRAFDEADSADFFGRGRLVQKLIKRLGEEDPLARFLAVVGPSGCGKSSVVKAGLLPALRRGGLPGSERWFLVEMTPGAYPLDELEIALTRVAAHPAGNLREHLDRDARGLGRAAALILPEDDSELAVIVDQFEEVFTLVEDEARRAQFIGLLAAAVANPRSRVRVIITLRADFYDRPLQYPEFGELVRSRMETVMPLSPEELEEAITQPASREGVAFEPGLVAAISGDVHAQPGALPLLQYALTELFQRRSDHTLTSDAYHALGGASGALAKRAEVLYHEQPEAGREIIRQMFLRLVALGEGTGDARRRAPRSELLAVADDADMTDEILDMYAAYRLLTLDHDPATRRPTVEIAHEAILWEWERLRSWIDESRHDIRQQRLLAAAAAEWYEAGRDASYLLRGARLDQMAAWSADARLALNQEERTYLETSVAETERQRSAEQERQRREMETQRLLAESQRRAANRLRYLAAGLGVFLVAAVALALYAFQQEVRAQAALAQAERESAVNHSLVLAGSALDSYENGNTVLATALALEALEIEEPPSEAEIAFREIAQGAGVRAVLHGHSSEIRSGALSPDGRYALTGSCAVLSEGEACAVGELIVWDVQAKVEVRRLEGHAGWVNAVSFAPDGRTALSASSDGMVIQWGMPDGVAIRRFEGHKAGINDVAFSPDGRVFATASDDATAALWDAETGEIILALEGHAAEIDSLAFSADGAMLATGGAEGMVILWDAASGDRLMALEGHGSRVTGVAFAAGERLVSVTRNNLISLWNLDTGDLERQQSSFIGNPTDLALSPDGRTLFFAELGHLRAWNIDQWSLQYGVSYHGLRMHRIVSLAVGASGTGIYGTESGDLIVWELPQTGANRRFGDETVRFTSAAESPDGRYLALGTADGVVILQEKSAGEEVRRFPGAVGWVWRIAFSGDGRTLFVASADWFGNTGAGSYTLWDVETGAKLHTLEGFDYIPYWASFSPDGRYALANSIQWGDFWEDNSHGDTIVWSVQTGEEALRLNTDLWVNASLFTEDGSAILTGSGTTTITGLIVWDAATGQELRHFLPDSTILSLALVPETPQVLAGLGSGEIQRIDYETGEVIHRYCCHSNWVRDLDLSVDQRYVISGDQSGLVILWDFAGGQEVRRFYGHTNFVWEAVFSADGRTAYSAGMDGKVIEWQVADRPLNELLSWVRANRYQQDFSCEERAQYRIEPLCDIS
ncbi:MAG: protein kinase [Anaerolineae bacterium]|nr:protein kinase [Anaerolineae bacterium]NUQ03182.1 protein kinase [Anaerolineae bacterium]